MLHCSTVPSPPKSGEKVADRPVEGAFWARQDARKAPSPNAVKDFGERIDNWLKTLKALHIKAWGKLFATANNATPGL